MAARCTLRGYRSSMTRLHGIGEEPNGGKKTELFLRLVQINNDFRTNQQRDST
jgi:hypothetical protein